MRPIIGINCELDYPKDKTPKATLNLSYIEAIEAAGGIPVLLAPRKNLTDIPEILARLDGLVLSGGDDIDPALYGEKEKHPSVNLLPKEKEHFDFALAKEAIAKEIPTLGICYGMQLMSVVDGGKLHQDIPSALPKAAEHRKIEHRVKIEKGSAVREICATEEIPVHSSHHQAVSEPGPSYRVTARSSDGVIEAIEPKQSKPGRFLIGVQWHPERSPETKALFHALVEAARGRKR